MNTYSLIIAIVIGLTGAASSLSLAGVDEAIASYRNGNFTSAVAELRPLAEQGDARAQHWLGIMYHLGKGVDRDDKQSIAWYLKAAEQGGVGAQTNLGSMYFEGSGAPQDDKLAVLWWSKAASQGSVAAQYHLATMIEQGRGVTKDEVQA